MRTREASSLRARAGEFLGFAFRSLREAQPWHCLITAVWLIAPVFQVRPQGAEAVRATRLFMLAYVALLVLRNPLWPQFWVPLLWAPAALPMPQ